MIHVDRVVIKTASGPGGVAGPLRVDLDGAVGVYYVLFHHHHNHARSLLLSIIISSSVVLSCSRPIIIMKNTSCYYLTHIQALY